jgi:gentisate 1,2-dioxygenase
MIEKGRFDTLGTLDELPQTYRDTLTAENLVPLWPSLRAVLPPGVPARKTKPAHWPYAQARPLLLQAGELTPIEKAERRVLVLANPGHGLEKMQATPSIYLGLQLLLPGEIAPAHRHTPNAIRMIVEGNGAYTTVDGEKIHMERGDLILTPTGLWHEHGQERGKPVIWLDVLDLPLVYYTETSYHDEGATQNLRPGQGRNAYGRGGLAPAPHFRRSEKAYPVLHYPWAETREALLQYGADASDVDAVQLAYINPETGRAPENILGFYALMLRPGQTLRLPSRSPSAIYHLIEGAAEMRVLDSVFTLAESDTACAPGYEAVTLRNLSPDRPAFLFIADEAPLHQKIGVYEERG